jgi:transposase-like protein
MSPQERVALRASAVQAVSAGERKSHVAQRLGITRQTLHSWVLKHQRGGAAALAAKPRGRTAIGYGTGYGVGEAREQQPTNSEGKFHALR